jgi:hypothetical protein
MNRMLYAIDGFFSLLRGLRPHMFLSFGILIITGILSIIPLMPEALSMALGPLALVQLYTGWVHIAISAPSPRPFYRRLPSFMSAFRGTALPTFVLWLALGISQEIPAALERKLWNMYSPSGLDFLKVPKTNGTAMDFWKLLLIVFAYLLPTVILVLPAHMVLTRVQTSMLPADERPILALDPSLRPDGKEGGAEHEYISMYQAWKTFSGASWIRLTMIYLKTFAMTLAIEIVLSLLVIAQLVVLVEWSLRE